MLIRQLFDKFATDSDLLIYNKSGKDDLEGTYYMTLMKIFIQISKKRLVVILNFFVNLMKKFLEDEIKMLVFACGELFSKICRIGHSSVLSLFEKNQKFSFL